MTVTGQADSPAIIGDLIDAIRHVEGVVGVRDRVSDLPKRPTEARVGEVAGGDQAGHPAML